MDRRAFITSSAAAAALSTLPARSAFAQNSAGTAAAPSPGDARLNAAFDQVLRETVRQSPEFATSLGLDTGKDADLRHMLGDNSYAAIAKDLARNRKAQALVTAVDPASLSPQARIDREVVLYSIQSNMVGPEKFGLSSPQGPYPITQQDGVYFSMPDFLASTHPVKTADDAEAYLDRLAMMGRQLDNETEVQRREAAKGRLAPDFSLDLALGQMANLRSPSPVDNQLVQALTSRTGPAKIAGDWQARAAKIVATQVYPALDRQIALLRLLRPSARSAAGIWAIPNGDAIYAAALAQATTTSLSPDEVHRMGLQQVAELTAQLDPILREQGLTQGSVGARLDQLNRLPAQLFANTDAGRAELLASLNAGVQAMQARLPKAFTNPPNAALEIRRVAPEIQDGAPNGYYFRAPLDGSRAAIYWINLKSVHDWPKYTLPSLTYHEGVPGHHLQISTAQRAPTHPLRKIAFFNAYLEGWALYAEQLADELGGYASPVERAGYLQSFLFRAARLVVDTGIHTKRWTHDQATKYLVDTVGFAPGRSQREVERYCVSPGQACSYKIGHAAWLRAREKAKAIAGDRFDLKHFHDVLEAGAMPLSMLERIVEERARAV
ncbi:MULTISPECIES: DUF885 family protein [unclassified Sphingomonas]|uniref:DUF885 domain-containing protein n=1 Tax=unclassified Sphingomonas TaxID=196159 RepID=UPI000E763253|nr:MULTISPECIES: DUF885 family protein [unclassified Sphingomonas]RKE50636.1 uncharacterized protein (DUF885 family) [Sphingomonas sp. PP-CC-1A-547]TCM08933.1 uncharacterized protein (DUF885 family) [Sphingomonas sp. PP-CC-3G-468]